VSAVGIPSGSLRQEQAESTRLAWAFIISLTLHLLIFGGYHTGRHFHWWQDLHWPAWLRPVKILAEALKKKPPPLVREQEPPLMFVDVSEAQATAEPPKDAKFYSNKNSQAANPEAEQNSDTPKITGKQTEVVKTEDVPREKFVPLQPTPRPAQPAPEEQPEVKAKPAAPPGDLTMAKPEPNPKKDEGEAPQPRPRTIKEALARHPENRLPGQKMKQDGGVQHHAIASLDTKATLYGEYDAALVEAICKRWYDLLDERQYASDSRGRVQVNFHLHSDGRITDVEMSQNTAGEVLGLLCVKAVQDPAPFNAWPREMRMKLDDPRSIRFTFIYY
jgi:outer membrane biosynthesis protein TonB